MEYNPRGVLVYRDTAANEISAEVVEARVSVLKYLLSQPATHETFYEADELTNVINATGIRKIVRPSPVCVTIDTEKEVARPIVLLKDSLLESLLLFILADDSAKSVSVPCIRNVIQ